MQNSSCFFQSGVISYLKEKNNMTPNTAKEALLKMREQILNSAMANTKNITTSEDDRSDVLDQAAAMHEQELQRAQRAREYKLLQSINIALHKISEGTYGICDDCEETLEVTRVAANPQTIRCLPCAEQHEKKGKSYV
jgi:DnaK suppressor protein